jgi:hypothetical protein
MTFTEWGNRPWPLADSGKCCNRCDDLKVLPARLKAIGYSERYATQMAQAVHQARLARMLDAGCFIPGRCWFCDQPALDGHLTCGRVECDEAKARELWRLRGKS